MNKIFHSAPIGASDWLLIIIISVAVYTIIGLEKWLRLHVFKKVRDA
jgi:hypothetical protein